MGHGTVNFIALELPPPGAGLNTVTDLLPTADREVAGILAVRRVLLMNVVASSLPLHSTFELSMKLEPTTFKAIDGLPLSLLLGEIAAIAGAGFCLVGVDAEPPAPQLTNAMLLARAARRTSVLMHSSILG